MKQIKGRRRNDELDITVSTSHTRCMTIFKKVRAKAQEQQTQQVIAAPHQNTISVLKPTMTATGTLPRVSTSAGKNAQR
ncbi:MAG: hypothetical protein ACEQSD_07085 [Flavobacteriales bacterium]